MPAAPKFLDLPAALRDPKKSRYAILPIPYDGTVSYKDGTAKGPAAILDASTHLERFDEELNAEFVEAGIATYPAVKPASTPEAQMKRVRAAAEPIIKAGKFLLSLGGEHSVTAPLVKAVSDHYGPISVLQIDAHADLRDTYTGTRLSHGAIMRRVLEITPRIAQVGIRSYSREEFEQCRPYVDRFITPQVIASDPRWIGRALDLLGENVYITVDIDGFDPAVAPGTGTPEPGGLTWQQGLDLLRSVCTRRRVLATDIVEVRPLGANQIVEYVAARLAYKIITYTQLPRA